MGSSEQGKTDLIFIEGNLNARKYIDNVLEPAVVPFARQHADRFILMDDNARPHRARIVDEYLSREHITRMNPWPACSPDLKPIAHF